MNARDLDAAIARGQVAADLIERVRGELQASMEAVLPVVGTQGLKVLVAGVELGVVMRWVEGLPRHD